MNRSFCTLLLAALWGTSPVLAQAGGAKIYAGIEIGGKGVKATVVEAQSDGLYKRLFAKTHNTTLSILRDGAFDKAALDDTVSAIARFMQTISTTYKLPPERVVVVGSSGLPKASNRDAFIAAVKKATGKDLRFIDDRTEVELTIAGVVPKALRDSSISLDIGSGNTKGGYKPAGGPLVYVAVPLGTVTFTQRVGQEVKKKEISFVQAAGLLREPELVAPLRKGAERMPELAKRQRVYLSGGMVWALVTLVKPEAIDQAYVTFTAADVAKFHKLVTAGSTKGFLPEPSTIADAGRRARARREAEAVNKAYTPDNLVAGAEILSALVEAFDLKDKTVVFPRNGFVGWLAAYIAGEGLDEPRTGRK